MKSADFLHLLSERVLVADGAMGTRLYEYGIHFDHCFDELNISQPHLIRQIHADYIHAGADIIETNTFGANLIRLQQWGLADKTREIAREGVILAKKTVAKLKTGRDILVAGSIGPLGKPIAPIGRITANEAAAAFREGIIGLLEGGVDLLLLETFMDQTEALVALNVARELDPTIGIVAMMSFTDEGKTVFGNKPEEVVRVLSQYGADVVGANCSVGPQGLGDVLDRMLRVPDVPLCVMPNAGMPTLVEGRYLYLSSPEYFGKQMEEFVERGVNIVGGCCGTNPQHIAAVSQKIRGKRPREHSPLPTNPERPILEVLAPAEPMEEDKPTELSAKLARGQFCISVELDPPRGIDPKVLIKGAALCKAAGIDAINIADSPLARARMSPLALAVLIRKEVDIEIIIHMSCRDRNLLGLQSECMGAHALGIRNILCVTGDPPQIGDYPDATGVFDVDSVGLTTLLKRLNDGVDLAGKKIDYHTNFTIGVAANPTAVDPQVEGDRFGRKMAAGCNFVMTQPIYDVAVLHKWMEETKPTVPVLVGILPLRNGRHAEFIHNEVPGMTVPASIRERMHKAGADGPAEGVRIAQEILLASREFVQGAYLMPPFNRFEMAIDVCRVLPAFGASTSKDVA